MKSLKWIFVITVLVFCASLAEAKVQIDIYGKTFKRLTIAVPSFKSEKTDSMRTDMNELLNRDLDLSGFFIVAPQSLMDKELTDEGVEKQEIKFGNWRSIGVDLLCKGRIVDKDGKIALEAWVYDAMDGSLMLAKRYVAEPADWRRVVHRLADEIILVATGEKGIMSSRILFVSGSRFNKELYTVDIDGSSPKKLTSFKSITLSPSVSSSGKYIAYTSYKEGKPNLFIMDAQGGRDIRADKRRRHEAGLAVAQREHVGFFSYVRPIFHNLLHERGDRREKGHYEKGRHTRVAFVLP